MPAPDWVNEEPQRDIPIAPGDYFDCFHRALKELAVLFSGQEERCQFDTRKRDEAIEHEEAAKRDFYSSFEYRGDGEERWVVFILTSAFFKYSYEGIVAPAQDTKREDENQTDYIADCATNYIFKNYLHNHVHERGQQINSSNYRRFRGEARYASDFDADNFANILLALSRSKSIRADSSWLIEHREDLETIFARNRCNKVFQLREQARGVDVGAADIPQAATSVDELLDREWLMRRRLSNQLSTHLVMHDRAVSSISVHFYGDIRIEDDAITRPKTQASVELNGQRIALGTLGDLSTLSRRQYKKGIDALVYHADVEYSRLLRENEYLRLYATESLQARIDQLAGQDLNGNRVR